MTKRKNEWVTYPEVELTIDDLKKHFNMIENQNLDPTNELEVEEKITEGVEESEEGKLTPEESEKFKAIMERIYNCYPKKTYTNEYRKKRQAKNKMAKKSRRNNRKSNG